MNRVVSPSLWRNTFKKSTKCSLPRESSCKMNERDRHAYVPRGIPWHRNLLSNVLNRSATNYVVKPTNTTAWSWNQPDPKKLMFRFTLDCSIWYLNGEIWVVCGFSGGRQCNIFIGCKLHGCISAKFGKTPQTGAIESYATVAQHGTGIFSYFCAHFGMFGRCGIILPRFRLRRQLQYRTALVKVW